MALKQEGQSLAHISVAVLLTAIAVLAVVGLVAYRSYLDDVTQQGTVSNATPVVAAPTIATATLGGGVSPVTPNDGSNLTLYIHGTATDANGCTDIDTVAGTPTWTGTFYHTDATGGAACTPATQLNLCATIASIATTGCTTGSADNQLTYEGTATVPYYAKATDATADAGATKIWTASVQVTDAPPSGLGLTPAASNTATTTVEVATTYQVGLSGNLAYGTVALGSDSAQQALTITNQGNGAIDATFAATSAGSAGNLDCTSTGSTDIPVAQIHYSLTTGFTYGTADTALTIPASATESELNLAAATNATPTTKSWYSILRMPSGASNTIRGQCTGTLTVTAKVDD